MHHIYDRAQAVLVWLGTADLDQRIWDITFNDVDLHDNDDKNRAEALIKEMCNKDYWNRLWIIQEISKARKISIHYGIGRVDWDIFIEKVEKNQSLANCVPLILANQLRQRFSGAHKLESLLKLHKKALCKEPRDKIYGFAGLAIDCYSRLPVDYGKTLFEVWKDVVLLRNSDRQVFQYDILQFARLVKSILGGPEIASAAELDAERNHDQNQTGGVGHNDVLVVHVLLRGIITHVGPTYEGLFSNLQEEDEWAFAVTELTPPNHLSEAYEENEFFRRLLGDLNDTDLERIHNFGHNMSFNPKEFLGREPRGKVEDNFYYLRRRMEQREVRNQEWSAASPHVMVEETTATLAASSQPRLFILEPDESRMPVPASYVGLAPGPARVGDFICHLYESDQAIVIREVENGMCRLIGVGVVAKGRHRGQRKAQGVKEESYKFAVPFVQDHGGSDVIELQMDLALAYELAI